MGYWNSRGLRGSTLEELLNMTHEAYRDKGLALVQKIPTPITPLKIDSQNSTITLAYFDQKSTVDYIGVVQGIPICFDAKETSQRYFPLKNIHSHQIDFMQAFERQKGLAFLLIHFQQYDEYFYLPFDALKRYWDAAAAGGRKSIPYDCFDPDLKIKVGQGFVIHYLEAVNTYLCKEKP